MYMYVFFMYKFSYQLVILLYNKILVNIFKLSDSYLFCGSQKNVGVVSL